MSIEQQWCEDLPVELAECALEIVGQMWRGCVGRLEGDAGEVCGVLASPAQAEELVTRLGRELMAQVLSVGLSERYGKHTGARRPCSCGAQQRFEGYRSRSLKTTIGPVEYRRAYYRCEACKQTHSMGDEALGLDEGSYSLPAQEAISLVCVELPFERSRVLLERLSGLCFSVSHAQHVVARHGQELEREQHEECEALFQGRLEQVPEQRRHRLYITLDATKTRLRDDWHDTKVGAVYTARRGRDGFDEPERTTYVTAVHEGVEQFGRTLYQEAARRGVEHAREVVVLGDGAPWNWNVAAEHYPGALQILDFYHACERLHQVGRAVHGEGSAAAKHWAQCNVDRLKEGKWKGLLCSLRGLRPTTKEGREAVRLAIGYFTANRQRMDYPTYRARGLQIGSGVVEAACKCVVGARCKRNGMRWTKPVVQSVLTLRCAMLNDRWDEYWGPRKAAA